MKNTVKYSGYIDPLASIGIGGWGFKWSDHGKFY